MADLKNDQVLDKIIEYSKCIGDGEENAVTSERFVLAVIDVIDGVEGIELAEAEKNALEELLTSRFHISEKDLPALGNLLSDYIEGGGEANTYLNVVHMDQCVYKAKAAALKRGETQLTAAEVLEKVLDEPSSFIKKAINTSVGHVQTEKEIADQVRKELDRLYDAAGRRRTRKEREESEPEDPRKDIEALSKRVSRIREQLSRLVFGQEYAIETVTAGYFQAEMNRRTDRDRTRPAGTFVFAGPPGVGKTFLVKNIVNILEMQKAFMPFDMSAYADPNAHMELIGYDDNYQKPKEGLLTKFVKEHPKCILLFDEIEKAHSNVIHLFLQILEEGILTDKKTQERVSFKDAMIFFTTNLGRELYDAPDAHNFSGVSGKVIMKALQREVNPYTRQPYFPAAICSRLALGSVVMFNHMSANSLCRIIETTIGKKAENYEKTYQFKTELDRNVFTALLFAEGGTVDARTLRGHAETFFDKEMLELVRLLSSEEHGGDLSKLERIRFEIELPADEEKPEAKEIAALFKTGERHNILVYSSPETVRRCAQCCQSANIIGVEDVDSVKSTLSSKNVGFAVIDLLYGTHGERRFLNIEDMESTARDIFWYIREKYADLPIYILQHPDRLLSKEEQSSYLEAGVQGFLTMEEDGEAFSAKVEDICEELYQRANMRKLACANKLIDFESGQWVSDDGTEAVITLFDFELSTAVDAEDTQNIMSNVSRPDVNFDDVIGAENAKEELRFFIEYLKDPKKLMESGLRPPRGVLLYGPPGTGKTMLAKAVASAAGVTFISAEGNQFIKRYLGEGKDSLHELFSVARKYAPSILFIDEFEVIAKERKGGDHSASNGEDVLTALLTEMDGFNTDIKRPVFVLAATNFDVTPGTDKSLDQALLRRFDSKIFVDLPSKEERIRFMKKKRDDSPAFAISDEKINNIALRSTGMSLSDLGSIMEQSLRTAIRKAEKKVTDQVLDEAFETFIGGEEKAWSASQLERTARHEAGHAFLCWHGGETPSYVTIVARGDHGGYMQYGGNEDKHVYTKEELLARIRTALGGRAAELVYYGKEDGVTTGAGADLQSATGTAKHIICSYGMDDSFGLAVIPPQAAEYGELSVEVRTAVNKILEEQLKESVEILKENLAAVDALVARLLSDNHLTGDEIKSIFEQNAVKKQG